MQRLVTAYFPQNSSSLSNHYSFHSILLRLAFEPLRKFPLKSRTHSFLGLSIQKGCFKEGCVWTSREGIAISHQADFRWFLSVIPSSILHSAPTLSRDPSFAIANLLEPIRKLKREKSALPLRISATPLPPTIEPVEPEPLSPLTIQLVRLQPPPLPDYRGEETPAKRPDMDVNIAPLRAWDDFFPGSDRFARPDFRDISKWNNRVVSNLLYYQTNYLVVAAMMISVVG